jgi:hypothetical protein
VRVGGGGGWRIVRVGHDGKVLKMAGAWQVCGRCVAALRQDFTLF